MEIESEVSKRLKKSELEEDSSRRANPLQEIIERLHANTVSNITPTDEPQLQKNENDLEIQPVIDNDDLCLLAQALQYNTSLQHLSLKIGSSCADGLKLLAKAINGNTSLTGLSLEILDNASDLGLIEVFRVLDNTVIENLWLTCNFNNQSVQALGTMLIINQTLAHLQLHTKERIDLKTLGEVLSFNTSLRSFVISGFKIDGRNGELLAHGLKSNGSLRRLSLNGLTNESCLAVANGLEVNSGLRSVDLSGEEMNDESILALAKALTVNKAIHNLELTAVVSDQGACILAEALQVNNTLHSLKLSGFDARTVKVKVPLISDVGAKAFANALKINPKLKRFELQSHEITEEGLVHLIQALAYNKSLGLLSLSEQDIFSMNKLFTPTLIIPRWKLELPIMQAIQQMFKTNFTLTNLSLEDILSLSHARQYLIKESNSKSLEVKKFFENNLKEQIDKFEIIDVYLERNREFKEQLEKEFRIAMEKKDLRQIEMLITKGIDTDDEVYTDADNAGRVGYFPTALHFAAYIGQLEVVKLLLASGADPFVEDWKSNTLLDYAKWGHHQEIIDFLSSLFQAKLGKVSRRKLSVQKELRSSTDVDIPVAALQQQVLQDLNPLRHSDNNDLPFSQKAPELTEKELFNKALEESKKTYEQLLQTTIEDFTHSIEQDKLLLEQRLLEEDKQKQALKEQIQKLEAELQKHAQEERSTSAAIQKRLKIQKDQLRKLKIKQHILWQEHEIKQKQKRMLERFQNSPNLLLYYRTIQVCIQQLFISCLAGSGGKTTLESGEVLDTTQQGIEFFGDLCNIAPIVGPAVNFILKWGVGKVLEKIDGARRENSVENMASLLSLTELKEISESVAQKLTIWYEPILKNLATLDDETQLREDKKKQGRIAKLKEGMKELKEELQEAMLKKKHKLSSCKAAEFAITWALDELEEDKFNPNQPLDDQFVWIIITKKASYNSDKSPSLIKKTQQITDDVAVNISKALGKKTVIAKIGERWETWHLWKMYTDCGIQTETELYGNKDAFTYGYCNGIGVKDAAEVAKMRRLPSQGENKKHQSKKETSKNSPTSPAHLHELKNVGVETKHLKEKLNKTEITAQINIEGVKKENSELKVEVEKLKKEKSELEVKVEKHGQELKEQKLQHQKEMEEMKKLIEGIQNQIQGRPSQEEAKSTSTTPFWGGTGHGSVSSQFQQTQQNPQSSSAQSQSKR